MLTDRHTGAYTRTQTHAHTHAHKSSLTYMRVVSLGISLMPAAHVTVMFPHVCLQVRVRACLYAFVCFGVRRPYLSSSSKCSFSLHRCTQPDGPRTCKQMLHIFTTRIQRVNCGSISVCQAHAHEPSDNEIVLVVTGPVEREGQQSGMGASS